MDGGVFWFWLRLWRARARLRFIIFNSFLGVVVAVTSGVGRPSTTFVVRSLCSSLGFFSTKNKTNYKECGEEVLRPLLAIPVLSVFHSCPVLTDVRFGPPRTRSSRHNVYDARPSPVVPGSHNKHSGVCFSTLEFWPFLIGSSSGAQFNLNHSYFHKHDVLHDVITSYFDLFYYFYYFIFIITNIFCYLSRPFSKKYFIRATRHVIYLTVLYTYV